MPCFDPLDSRSSEIIYRDNPEVAAMLCAVLSFMEQDEDFVRNTYLLHALDNINWDEAGVTRKRLESWWKQHKLEDNARRQREQKERERQIKRKALRQKAMDKLTPAERRALGL